MRLKILSVIAAASLAAACAATPGGGAGSADSAASASAPAPASASYAPGSQQDLAVNVGDRVHFAFDKYDLTDQTRKVLQNQAAWLATNSGTKVIIEGHCDERGTREYNLALGERRANAVSSYLMAQGVAKDRIQTISYGKERPEDPASNERAWAKNRRSVTVIK